MSNCSCCGGERTWPSPIANRPGLPALRYRAGTHASFFDTMKARLSTITTLDGDVDAAHRRELEDLRTRRSDDPAIAALDAWAMVADILTFYQERIANEGFLRTATERRSILELARLVGYELRPGVAATTYLAYTLDEDRSVTPPRPSAVTIPAGARAQSVPGPGELPQSFETSDDLAARSSWNALKVRRTRPQTRNSVNARGLYLKGVATNLKPNDPLIVDFGDGSAVPYRVVTVTPDPPHDRTRVTLSSWVTLREMLDMLSAATKSIKAEIDNLPNEAAKKAAKDIVKELDKILDGFAKTEGSARLSLIQPAAARIAKLTAPVANLESVTGPIVDLHAAFAMARDILAFGDGELVEAAPPHVKSTLENPMDVLGTLEIKPSVPPAHSTKLPRDVATQFGGSGDALKRLLVATRPRLQDSLYPALQTISITDAVAIEVHRLTPTALFGHNAAPQPLRFNPSTGEITQRGDWPIIEDGTGPGAELVVAHARRVHEEETVVNLDAVYDNITPGTWLVVETATTPLTTAGIQVVKAGAVSAGIGRSEYGMSGKTTRIRLASASGRPTPKWITLVGQKHVDGEFNALRRTVVYAQGDRLDVVDAPIESPIGTCDAGSANEIELGELYDGLESGRWLVVSGERVITGTSGVHASELVMLAGVEHKVDPNVAGDTIHTFITLAEELAYCYTRDSVLIYGNVVKATQGETRTEVLGSGDATSPLQRLPLRQSPLTFIPAPNPTGVSSTLTVRVSDVQWHEHDNLFDAGPTDRIFITRTDDDAKTTVTFGTGEHGTRPPTGPENIRAVYRNGLGKSGNVKAETVTLLATRPLGVREVTNPIRASGGADRETRDQARVNAPLGVMALNRLVSTEDYADFARTFAGIGKADAVRLSSGGEQLVHVTIAGVDDIPIDESSDLYRNLVKAERDFGDPYLPIHINVRELIALVISVKLQVQADYEFASVAPKVRAKLLETFGFERRDLGQPVFLSEVMSAIQNVAGVAWADIDVLEGISEAELASPAAIAERILKAASAPRPSHYVNARLAETVTQTGSGRTAGTATDGIFPAQLAILVADVPDTLILNEVSGER